MIDKAPSQIRSMFDRVAHRYDLVNRLLSLGIDQYWRWRVGRLARRTPHTHYLDLASGTGDLLVEVVTTQPSIQRAVGLDLSEKMLDVQRQKIQSAPFVEKVTLIQGDMTQMPFSDGEFDLVTIAFGIRNVENKEAALRDIFRVMAPDGQLLILEFSLPKLPVIRDLYLLYFRHVLPKVGGWISGDQNAYRYLNQSVESWVTTSEMQKLVAAAGFCQFNAISLTFGIATVFCVKK